MPVIAGRDIATNDVGIMGGGVAVLVASVLPWYGASGGGFSVSVSGWGAGFTAWFSILLCLVVAGAVAARVFAGTRLPAAGSVGPALLLAAAAGLASLLIIIRLLSLPSGGAFNFHYGARFGLFLGLLGALVEVAFCALAFRTSGEKLPSKRAS